MPAPNTEVPRSPAAAQKQKGRPTARIQALIPVGIAVLFLIPFLRKAFSMDDPLYIWMAEQILKHPLNPYGFSANWEFLTAAPFYEQMWSPPLNSYFIATIMRLIGLSELRLHLAYLLPAVAVSYGTYVIAKRFCSRPVDAALAAIFTPAFLVCGSTVMSDMLMLAFWTWSVVLWLKGMDEKRTRMIALSCVLIAFTALTKYYGMVLFPMLVAHSLLAKRRPGWWTLCLLVPVLVLAGYQHWTEGLYGRGLLLDAFGVSGKFGSMPAVVIIPRIVVGLSFTGGCIASAVFLGPMLWSRKALAGWIGLGMVVAVLAGVLGSGTGIRIDLTGQARWILALHLGLFAAAGASLIVLSAKDLAAKRDSDSALLFLWLVGVFISASLLNWTVNGRAILPMAPAAGILMMRRLQTRGYARASLMLPLALSALLALTVARADYQFANSQRAVAYAIHERQTEGTVWFAGHWGFQYYMQRLGARPLDENTTEYVLGDLLVIPSNNPYPNEPPEGVTAERGGYPGPQWLSTMSRVKQTGFHAAMYGPVPYGLGLTTPEYYFLIPVDEANIDLLSYR